MKVSIPEISWHNREPVLSIDIQPQNSSNNIYRVATGGCDNFILIWKLKITAEGNIDVSVLSELVRHQKSVNVVKWSPNGEILASGDDDGNIILWRLKTDSIPSLDEKEDEFEERWNVHKVLRGHREDVYDICWSPTSNKLLSGSVDNTAILWDIHSAKSEYIISDHKGFVQGVAWDPKSQYVATLSSDRVCRIFTANGRRIVSRIGRGTLPVDETHDLFEKEVKYFHDDTFKTYFRRLCFSPDGNLLIVPSGSVETNEQKNILCGTFAFSVESLKRPIFILPSGKQCSIVVKCCPILFELREKGPSPVIDLPYRMIIAVATDKDVLIYDTQQNSPCVHLQNIHYTRLTDLTWSSDGLLLAASSTDGFVTLVTFKEGELGTPYLEPENEVDEDPVNSSGVETQTQDPMETSVTEMMNIEVTPSIPDIVKQRKPSFLEQWAQNGQKEKRQSCDGFVSNNSPGTSSHDSENPVEVKKRRIIPTLICKEVSAKRNTCKKSMKLVSESDGSAKKRLQPIRLGEASKHLKDIAVCITADDQKPVIDQLNVCQSSNKKKQQVVKDVADSDNLLAKQSDDRKNNISANSKESPKICKTPKSNNSTTSKDNSSSTKKKKLNTPSSNTTLLEFFKPINKTPNSSSKTEAKTIFNPKKLFAETKTQQAEELTMTKSSDQGFTLKTQIQESTTLNPQGQEADKSFMNDNSDITEDLVLQVDDSEESTATKMTEEVMNSHPTDTDLNNAIKETKPARRVPFTTLCTSKTKR